MRGEWYQIVLIVLGVVATALFSVFLFRELNPEYKMYQNDYVALEEFRSTYSGMPSPPFKFGVKQIVIESDDNGPATIDRCISCHVAMKFEHFSPTKIAYDLNGNIILNEEGHPQLVPNENYVWKKLDEKIASLTDPKEIEVLKQEGKSSEIKDRLKEAERLESYKTAHVGEHSYDVTKVLQMHPLMGRETRPFEYHPLEEYGCTSCHSGNGRGLTTMKAHGPVFDGQYEETFMGPQPEFLESDPKNDPPFSKMFNHKPGHGLLFHTTPILVGSLIQAKCVQCHQTSQQAFESLYDSAYVVADQRKKKSNAILNAFSNEKEALISLLNLRKQLDEKGYKKTLADLEEQVEDYTLPPKELEQKSSQVSYLIRVGDSAQSKIDESISEILGSKKLADQLFQFKGSVDQFIEKNRDNPEATGTLFIKAAQADLQKEILKHVEETSTSFQEAVRDQDTISAMASDVDALTRDYHRGKNLFISQACYSCHRITGISRGGIGPELTYEGEFYPWFIKESMVWPQADLKTSTMPNYKLDHEELEGLMTYLLGQTREGKTTSEVNQKALTSRWEAGRKLPWERPISPSKIKDLHYSMTVFATEGCAACHRLRGFESNVGFTVEKENPDFETILEERQWFRKLFPEDLAGSTIVERIDEKQKEIDERISSDVREGSILEEIDEKFPKTVESYNTNFKFALRAKKDEEWKERVRRVMMIYVQEYGLGRLIGPRPNWSGIYRSDEWLIGHFRKPSAYSPRSIMPVMPFDDTKFYALTYMLDVLAKKNRDEWRKVWEVKGFNPEQAYQVYCSQCHGEFLHGNGPVAEWIYPIPKNLRNADFLRNLTRRNALTSITHGVKGTPMPPWGEVADDKPMADGIPVLNDQQIGHLVDWLFISLRGGMVIRGEEDVPKWQYRPEDVLEELHKEGEEFIPQEEDRKPIINELKFESASFLPRLGAVEPLNVEEVFDVKPNPIPGQKEDHYYIKEKYYTQSNLDQGQAFFELNCAVCHGKEADGAGFRAGSMYDAKPRMLTNLSWLHTRDDLRLLRSIKYGVPGTSMTPWGDQTNALQRLQLVMFIRTLSSEQIYRDELLSAIYQSYELPQIYIQQARTVADEKLKAIKNQIEEIKSQEPSVENYQEEMKLKEKRKEYESFDRILTQLKDEVKEEHDLFNRLGVSLIMKHANKEELNQYFEFIRLNSGRYSYENGKLILNVNSNESKIQNDLITSFEKRIQRLEDRKKQIEGRIASASRNEKLSDLQVEINGWTQIKNSLISAFEEGRRSFKKQQELFTQYEKQLSEINNGQV